MTYKHNPKGSNLTDAELNYELRLKGNESPRNEILYGRVENDDLTKEISLKLIQELEDKGDGYHIPGSTFTKADVYTPTEYDSNNMFFQVVKLRRVGKLRFK